MRYEAAFLSADEQARVHETSLRILADVGIRVHGDVAVPLLAEAGAEVDAERGLVQDPALAGRDGARVGAAVVRPGRPEPGPRLRRAVARDPLRDGRHGRVHA